MRAFYFPKIILLIFVSTLMSFTYSNPVKKPNVIFFLVDDMGWMDIGANGSTFYETPNIDRLASEGVRFTQAYAASPVCSPTRASILTGKNPARINLTQWIGGPGNPDYDRNLPLEEVLFPELMKEAGYSTIFLGKWHLNNQAGEGAFWPDKQGFDSNIGGHFRGGLYIKNKYFSPWDIPNLENGPDGEYMTDRLAQEASSYIDKNAQNPFLLYLSFYQAHAPFSAPQDRIEKYNKKQGQLGLTDEERFVEETTGDKTFTYRKKQDHPTYAAMVESMDMAVGKVLQKVKEKGIEDNTIVIFFSDNGGLSTSEGIPTANTPLRYGKGWLYEGGIREPAIVKWPGEAKAGLVSDAVITSMDFYPSILEMIGQPLRPDLHVDGKSIVPLLKGKTEEIHDATYFHYPHRSNQNGSPSSAIREGDYKLIVFLNDNRLELYNIKDDISEQNNLADKLPEVTNRLYSKLEKWWNEVDARFPKEYKKPRLDAGAYHNLRGGLQNSLIKFQTEKKGRVAFLGGSITHNGGWRDSICNYLQNRFPETEFDFIPAGIPSTGSTPAAFRMERDVFANGPVDLLFEEAAVNDATNGRSETEQIRAMEGIVRHARLRNPATDIVIMHFVDPGKMKIYREGGIPEVIQNHEKVAIHYNIPTINLAKEVTERIDAGEFTWENDFKNLHPSPFGQNIYYLSMKTMLENVWKDATAKENNIVKHSLPKPIKDLNYSNGVLVDISNAKRSGDWMIVDNWEPSDGVPTRPNYTKVPMLIGTNEKGKIKLEFEGNTIGIAVAAGPDAGILEYRIDKKDWQEYDLRPRAGKSLHLPRYYTIATDLENKTHTMEIRMKQADDAQGKTLACRIRYFFVNRNEATIPN